MKCKLALLTILFLLTINLFAHEGHEDSPLAMKANHGGTVKSGKELNLEYVVTGGEIKLFPVSHEGKDLPLNEVKLNVTAKLPRGKTAAVKIKNQDGAFVAQVDFKDAYRVEMNITANYNGKTDIFNVQVEK